MGSIVDPALAAANRESGRYAPLRPLAPLPGHISNPYTLAWPAYRWRSAAFTDSPIAIERLYAERHPKL